MSAIVPQQSWPRTVGSFLAGALIFGLAYCQAPLYYSNQNQYFLQGLAHAGHGHLAEDWLVNTPDSTPVFSGLVAITYRFLDPAAFHLFYLLVFGVYVVSQVGLFSFLTREQATPWLRLGFFALLLLVHSAAVRWASYRLFGLDYPWYFQAGVAGQYVLGAMFQPSTFGVLLLLAIWLFVIDRPFAAVFSACLAASIHSTYLVGAAILTFAFLVVLWREGRVRRGLLLCGWALLLVLPVTLFVLVRFRPSSAEAFVEAQRILVHDRIPHHCLPQLWCDGIALAQTAWVLLAVWLSRGTRLGAVLFVAFLAALVLTVHQVVTASDTLALLFPWRISAVLVPAATGIILGRLVLFAAPWLHTKAAGILCIVTVLVLVSSGLAIQFLRQGFQSSPEEVPMMDFVKARKSNGEVYLLPVKMPDPPLKKTTRGSLSGDFKPVAAKKIDDRLIPVDLQRFRLYTGAPIFVDFKSIPYKDTDVLEWRDRLEVCQRIYAQLRSGPLAKVHDELRRRGITHVVTTVDLELRGDGWRQVHEDAAYRVYRVD